jgi:hypothetical protein
VFFIKISALGVVARGFRIWRMGAAALATAAAGFFTGTAPNQKHGRNQYNDQGKELPFHAANITANQNRATGIFISSAGRELRLPSPNIAGK